MKKLISIIISALLIFALVACSDNDNEQIQEPVPTVTSTPTPEPTATPEPESKAGVVKVIELTLDGITLMRGQEVDVIEPCGDYFKVNFNGETYYINSSYVKLRSADAVEEHIEYAKSGASLYDNPMLAGQAQLLDMNTEVTVIDINVNVAFVKCGDRLGFMSKDELSTSIIVQYFDWGGGNSGGGADGGDIALGFNPLKSKPNIVLLEETNLQNLQFVPEKGVIFADSASAYIAVLGYGDDVKVTNCTDETYTILFEDSFYNVPSYAVRLDGEEKYTEWVAYAAKQADAYKYITLQNKTDTLQTNDEINIVEEFENVYMVYINNHLAYMAKEDTSKTKIEIQYYDWGGGGSGGAEWTEPVL